MAITIVTRAGLARPLTHTEVDTNFTRLNAFKVEQTSETGFALLPAGTTAQRGTGVAGSLRFNTTNNQGELYTGSAWVNVLTTTGTQTANTILAAPDGSSGAPSFRALATADIPSSALGSGTASSTTFLRGDRSWATVTSGASISNNTTADASYYPLWATTTSGTPSTVYVSDTKLYFNPSTGTLNATNFNSLSDITLKENVTTIENATQTLQGLSGVEFDWKDNGKKSAGVIAQKLEEILPHLVETSNTGIKSVNYSGLVAYLIESVKELSNRVEQLERVS